MIWALLSTAAFFGGATGIVVMLIRSAKTIEDCECETCEVEEGSPSEKASESTTSQNV